MEFEIRFKKMAEISASVQRYVDANFKNKFYCPVCGGAAVEMPSRKYRKCACGWESEYSQRTSGGNDWSEKYQSFLTDYSKIEVGDWFWTRGNVREDWKSVPRELGRGMDDETQAREWVVKNFGEVHAKNIFG